MEEADLSWSARFCAAQLLSLIMRLIRPFYGGAMGDVKARC